MAISTADIKKLREATGAGMTDCKNALVEADGDYDKAVEQLRIKGLKGVAKREGRAASNGLVIAKLDGTTSGTLLELNCETDFVAKSAKFGELAQSVVDAAFGTTDAPRCSPCRSTASR
jgi:elongation factor Ts